MILVSVLKQVGLAPALLAASLFMVGSTGFAGQNAFVAASNVAGQNSQAVSGVHYLGADLQPERHDTDQHRLDRLHGVGRGHSGEREGEVVDRVQELHGLRPSSPWTITCDNGSTLGETVAGATTFDVLLTQ